MALGTVVGLLGTARLVELEVSITCRKESDSLTGLDVAWLPDTRQAVDLYHWLWGDHQFTRLHRSLLRNN